MAWPSWTVDDWNGCLLRHFFFARPGGDSGPVVQLVVTAEEFARAAGAVEGSAKEVRDAFLAAMRELLKSSGQLLGRSAMEAASHWNEATDADPPFVAHLLATCLLASDISDERAAQGNFRKRLDKLFGRQGSNHALEQLPRLWESLSRWLSRPTQRRVSRALVLPDVGHLRIIGVPLRLSFPPRKDELRLVDLLDEEGLLGQEPPVVVVLSYLAGHSSRFGARFRKAFEDFRRHFNRGTPSLERTPFWSAIRGAALAGARSTQAPSGNATFMMEPDLLDGGHFRLVTLVDGVAASRLPKGLGALPLEGLVGGYEYVLASVSTADDQSVDDATRQILNAAGSRTLAGHAWQGLARAVREGVLLFTTDDGGNALLSLRLPEMGSTVDILVRERIADALRDALPAHSLSGPHLPSNYPSWRELRSIKAAELLRAEFASIIPLAQIRCLQRTLPPTVLRLRDGIRLDGGAWLGTPGFLPSATVPDSLAASLRSPSISIPLHSDSTSPGTWLFRGVAEALDGEYDIVVSGPKPCTTALVFRDTVTSVAYRPPLPGRWMTEGIDADVDEVVGLPVSLPMAASPTQSPITIRPDGSVTERTPGEREMADRFGTALAATSLGRQGIPEAALREMVATAFSDAHSLAWDIMRSWVEVGALSRLVGSRWRTISYFAVPPRVVAHQTPDGLRAALIGLLPAGLRRAAIAAAPRTGVALDVDWKAMSIFTPPVVRLRAQSVAALSALAAHLSLPAIAWAPSPQDVFRAAATLLGARRGGAPKNYDVFAHWNWTRLRFRRGSAPATEAVSLEWLRRPARPDAPDYYLVRRGQDLLWWGRSRVWALHIVAAAAKRTLLAAARDTAVECSRPGQTYLPVGVARLAVALGAAPSGPATSGDVYRYSLPFDSFRRSLVSCFWPDADRPTGSLQGQVRWIAASVKSLRDVPLVGMPSVVRHALLRFGDEEAKHLAASPRIPLSMLPLLLSIARHSKTPPQ